jgi:hypothetical protein
MRSIIWVLGGIPLVWGLSDYEALAVVKGFADHFLAPGNREVAESINR